MKRAAVLLGDEDGFHFVAVAGPQQPFSRAVGGNLLGDDCGTRKREVFAELAPKLLGDVGHAFEIGCAARLLPDYIKDVSAKSRRLRFH